jgi:hypothetical protein
MESRTLKTRAEVHDIEFDNHTLSQDKVEVARSREYVADLEERQHIQLSEWEYRPLRREHQGTLDGRDDN